MTLHRNRAVIALLAQNRCPSEQLCRRPEEILRIAIVIDRKFLKLKRSAKQAIERLFDDLGDDAGTDGPAAFSQSESQSELDTDGVDQFHGHVGVVARHHHLCAVQERDLARDVCRS